MDLGKVFFFFFSIIFYIYISEKCKLHNQWKQIFINFEFCKIVLFSYFNGVKFFSFETCANRKLIFYEKRISKVSFFPNILYIFLFQNLFSHSNPKILSKS